MRSITARLIADTGLIGMYGYDVAQNGTASAIASLTYAGQIDLEASDIVSTGAGSITSTPISGSTQTIIPSAAPFGGGTIYLGGLDSSGRSTSRTADSSRRIAARSTCKPNRGFFSTTGAAST